VTAYQAYRSGHLELKALLIEISATSASRNRTLTTRGAAVLVVAEFEAFLRDLLQERIDAIAMPWPGLAPGEKKVVAAEILREFSDLEASFGSDGVASDRDGDRVHALIQRVAGWVGTPGEFARTGTRPAVTGFYDPSKVVRIIEKVLVQLRADGRPFFDWLGMRGHDQSLHRSALEGLITLRGDVAHQLRGNMQPTPEEVLDQLKRCGFLARMIRMYVADR
jgi:hypothetical protein